MGRIMAIDYGKKRCGIAVTDPLKIIANALCTVDTAQLEKFVKDYVGKESVETIVFGEPKQVNGEESETMRSIKPLVERMRKALPAVKITFYDERFTTKLALRTMIDGGLSKKGRNNKNGTLDKVSATIILQSYMESTEYQL
ncbi:MAG: Holliday junction resolvase RuvX [Bacteroidales bacterium]|nr:Holliday junction resolvase RuvX [Bacteroidales bacterium]